MNFIGNIGRKPAGMSSVNNVKYKCYFIWNANLFVFYVNILYLKTLSPNDQGFLSKDVPLRVSRPLRIMKNQNLMGIDY